MSAQTSFAWCSDCGYFGPDFKTEEYLPYVDEGREMPGGKTYECPKCGLTTGEQVIQEHFEPLKADGVSAGKLSVEDRKYICGDLHRQCAVEDQLRKAEAKITAWRAYNEVTTPAEKAYEEAKATAWKAYNEAKAPALKAYNEAMTTAEKAYREATAQAEKKEAEAIA